MAGAGLIRRRQVLSMDRNPDDTNVNIRLDVTGILRWGAQPPTGIQRVELALAHCARNDAAIEFVAFDFRRRTFVPLRSFEQAYLSHILDENRRYGSGSEPHPSLTRRLTFFRAKVEHYGPDTRHRIARRLANNSWSAFFKMGSALAFLAARLVTRMWATVRSSFEDTRNGVGRDGSICLISYAVSMDRRLETADNYLGRRAYLIHDLASLDGAGLASSKYARRFELMLGRAIGNAETIMCLSQTVRSEIEIWASDHHLTVPSIGVCPFRNSLSYEGARVTPMEQLVGKDFVIFCSTFHPRKRQHLVVALWRRLAESIGVGKLPYLVLIGQAGKGYSALASELERAGIVASKIVILHDVDDSSLRWAYKNAKFSVFPSTSEGWGLGVSEAMFFGLPVVHTSLPALSEASQGMMPTFAADDFDAMFEVVAKLVAQPELISQLARQCGHISKAGANAFANCLFGSLTTIDRPGKVSLDGIS